MLNYMLLGQSSVDIPCFDPSAGTTYPVCEALPEEYALAGSTHEDTQAF